MLSCRIFKDTINCNFVTLYVIMILYLEVIVLLLFLGLSCWLAIEVDMKIDSCQMCLLHHPSLSQTFYFDYISL